MISTLWKCLKKRLFVSGGVTCGERFHLGVLSFVSTPDTLSIGHDVYIGKFCTIQCSGRIGCGVLISNSVGIVGRRDHDMRAVGVYIRHAPWVGDNVSQAQQPANRVDIADDVWIGFGCTILSGVRIGRGAIISAGSVVRHDVAPYEIVAGNPARPVGRRFTDAQISQHETALSSGDSKL
ncbi:MAG: acetyltransferase [Alphaproteobacteria bacterium]|nr:MAG: acetyltransferase [Alphaproteobacteria bacterium]